MKEANVGSVMCSYNRVNGQYACENKHLLHGHPRSASGASRATCSPTTAPRTNTGSVARRTGSTSSRGRASPTARPVDTAAIAHRDRPGQADTSTSTCAASCARCSRSASSIARPTPTTTRRSTRKRTRDVAQASRRAAITLLQERRRRAAARGRQAARGSRVIGADADRFKTGGGSGDVDAARRRPRRARAIAAARGLGRAGDLRRRHRRRGARRPRRRAPTWRSSFAPTTRRGHRPAPASTCCDDAPSYSKRRQGRD